MDTPRPSPRTNWTRRVPHPVPSQRTRNPSVFVSIVHSATAGFSLSPLSSCDACSASLSSCACAASAALGGLAAAAPTGYASHQHAPPDCAWPARSATGGCSPQVLLRRALLRDMLVLTLCPLTPLQALVLARNQAPRPLLPPLPALDQLRPRAQASSPLRRCAASYSSVEQGGTRARLTRSLCAQDVWACLVRQLPHVRSLHQVSAPYPLPPSLPGSNA